MTNEQIIKAVKEAIVDSIDVDKEQVNMNSVLVDDLEAESLDIIDLLFKAGKDLGVRVSMRDLQNKIRGGMSQEEFFDEQGFVSKEGYSHLQNLFSDKISEESLSNLTAKDLLSFLDVEFIVQMFKEKIGVE